MTKPYTPEYGNRIEHAIVRLLLVEMEKAGFVPVTVFDSEEYVPPIGMVDENRSSLFRTEYTDNPDAVIQKINEKTVLDAIFAVDAIVTLHFAPHDDLSKWGNLGVMLVQGNEEDLISDYHCSNENFSEVLNKVQDIVEKGVITFS